MKMKNNVIMCIYYTKNIVWFFTNKLIINVNGATLMTTSITHHLLNELGVK
jgi:hypothetical protein